MQVRAAMLSSLTTFGVGGAAQQVIDCHDLEDVKAAVALARDRRLPFFVLGGGSNVLASDAGYGGVIIRPLLSEGTYAPRLDGTDASGRVIVTAGAGVSWDDLVSYACERGWWGLENLAGIPGNVGASPVQNIGAYGAEAADTIHGVEIFDAEAGTERTLTAQECALGYRDSIFKRAHLLIVLRVAFALSKEPAPRISYKDLIAAQEAGAALETPEQIATAVRGIRAKKFPTLGVEGTAGSFFKNPVISQELYAELATRYPGLPSFPQADGRVKVPLAYVLDRILSLRGFRRGAARLYEKQPLVLVADNGASAHEVEMLADEVAQRVFAATGISIEREVCSLA